MSVFKLSQSVFGAALLAWAVVATADAAQAQPAAPPPRPAPAVAAPPPGTSASDATSDPTRAGTAVVVRGGQPVGLGLILGSDGRVVASRTSLGGAKRNLTLRFADGSTVAATVGHEDAARDLALLVPARLVWTRGLVPAAATPSDGAGLEMFELKRNRLERRPVRLKGPPGGAAVDLELAPPFLPGSPVVDGAGRAVGVVVQSCEGGTAAAPCKPRPRLVSVAGLRAFLRALPPSAAIPSSYLGVRGERAVGTHARGVRVVEVAPGSPAAALKLVAGAQGDLVLAVAGQPVTTPEELTRALGRHAPGERVSLTLFSRGEYRQVDVVLGRAPTTGSAPASPGGPAGAPPPARPAPAGSPSDGAPKDFGTRR